MKTTREHRDTERNAIQSSSVAGPKTGDVKIEATKTLELVDGEFSTRLKWLPSDAIMARHVEQTPTTLLARMGTLHCLMCAGAQGEQNVFVACPVKSRCSIASRWNRAPCQKRNCSDGTGCRCMCDCRLPVSR